MNTQSKGIARRFEPAEPRKLLMNRRIKVAATLTGIALALGALANAVFLGDAFMDIFPKSLGPSVRATVEAGDCENRSGWVIEEPEGTLVTSPINTGASFLSETRVVLRLQGRVEQAIVVDDVRIEVLDRSDSYPGAAILPPYCEGGGLDTTEYFLDLDAKQPKLTAKKREDLAPALRRKEIVDFPLVITNDDPHQVVIEPVTANRVSWVMHVDWSSEGTEDTLTVRHGNSSFVTDSGEEGMLYCSIAAGWTPPPCSTD